MIGRLSGILLEKNPPQILLEVQGVGYEVSVPMSTFYNLPALHERVLLHTQPGCGGCAGLCHMPCAWGGMGLGQLATEGLRMRNGRLG